MTALSIQEPWITMIAMGRKTIETRTWKTNYRGPLLLVGSKRPAGIYAGKSACIADLVDCLPMIAADEPAACCYRYPCAYSWVLSNVRQVANVPIKGQLGLYEVDEEKVIIRG